jgi:hypothetical protein
MSLVALLTGVICIILFAFFNFKDNLDSDTEKGLLVTMFFGFFTPLCYVFFWIIVRVVLWVIDGFMSDKKSTTTNA